MIYSVVHFITVTKNTANRKVCLSLLTRSLISLTFCYVFCIEPYYSTDLITSHVKAVYAYREVVWLQASTWIQFYISISIWFQGKFDKQLPVKVWFTFGSQIWSTSVKYYWCCVLRKRKIMTCFLCLWFLVKSAIYYCLYFKHF